MYKHMRVVNKFPAKYVRDIVAYVMNVYSFSPM